MSILQFTYALLTYPTHLDKQAYAAWMNGLYPVKNIQLAHEKSSSTTDYEHTHIVVHFSKRVRTRDASLRDFDYPNAQPTELHPQEMLHPNIKILQGAKAYKDALKYIAKEDSTVKVEAPSICDLVWECQTLEDALSKYVQKPSDVPGIIALFKAKPATSLWIGIEPRDWQIPFYDMIREDFSERKVYWLKSDGNSGKTYFMKYMLQEHPSDTLLVTDAYLTKDIALIIKNAIDGGNTCRYIFFDCARSFTFPAQFYQMLERCKDGLMTSTKYMSASISFRNAVLVVMANQWPDVSKLTWDRWRCYLIDQGILCPIDTAEVKAPTPQSSPSSSLPQWGSPDPYTLPFLEYSQ